MQLFASEILIALVFAVLVATGWTLAGWSRKKTRELRARLPKFPPGV